MKTDHRLVDHFGITHPTIAHALMANHDEVGNERVYWDPDTRELIVRPHAPWSLHEVACCAGDHHDYGTAAEYWLMDDGSVIYAQDVYAAFPSLSALWAALDAAQA